jgi:L-fuculose-phosphate aldolase
MSRIEELVKYGRLLHQKNLVIGAGGNISARDGQYIVIKKKGADMSEGKKTDYVRVPLEKTSGQKKELSSETPLHVACYKASRDVRAVVHFHSPATVAVAEKIHFLKSTSYEFDCLLKKTVPVIEYIRPGSAELGKAAAEEITSGATAVIMKKHGAVTVGKDPDEAYLRALALERACVTFLYI